MFRCFCVLSSKLALRGQLSQSSGQEYDDLPQQSLSPTHCLMDLQDQQCVDVRAEDPYSHISCRNLLVCRPNIHLAKYLITQLKGNFVSIDLLLSLIFHKSLQSLSDTVYTMMMLIFEILHYRVSLYLCAVRTSEFSYALTTSSDSRYDFGFPSFLTPHSLFLQALARRMYSFTTWIM